MKRIMIVSAGLGLLSCSNIFTSKPQLVTLKNPTKYSLELSAITEAVGSGGTTTQRIKGSINIEPGKTTQVPKGQKVWLEKLEFYYMPGATPAVPPVTLTTPANTKSIISMDQDGATTAEIELNPGKKIKIGFFRKMEQINLKHKEFMPTKSSYVFDLATNSFK